MEDKFHWVYIQDIAGERRIIVKDCTEEDNQALDEVVVVGMVYSAKVILQVRLLQLTRMYLKVAHKLI